MSRPKGAKNISTLQVKRIAQSIIHDPGYLAGLKRRIMNGRAPHMEQLLFYYAHGKPTESLKVEATLNVIVSHAANEFATRLLSGPRVVPTLSRPALPAAPGGGAETTNGAVEHNGSGGPAL